MHTQIQIPFSHFAPFGSFGIHAKDTNFIFGTPQTYIDTDTHTCTHMYRYTQIHTDTHIQAHIDTDTHTHRYTLRHTQTHACLYTHTYTYTHTCVCGKSKEIVTSNALLS